jgi:thiopeptide-type bacteriocin biosynthesis protein
MIWLSVHLFYDDSLDFLLINGIQPFINEHKKSLSNWFFIRYTEGGQHIRLRLKIDENQAINMRSIIKEYFNDFLQKFSSIDKVKNSKNNFNSRLEFPKYEPEMERYGGEIGLKISEQFFQYASEFVLEYLDENSDYENKLLIATLMNYNLGLVYFEDKNELEHFFEKIAADWLNFNFQYLELPKQQIIQQIKAIKADTKPILQPLLKEYFINNKTGMEDDFSDWRKQNLEIKQQLLKLKRTKPISKILESYIHMNNNRFGISNFDESLVSELLIWTDLDSND